MTTQISLQQYRNEIKKMIGHTINSVHVLYDPDLLVAGISLTHVFDDDKKEAFILGLNGNLIFSNKNHKLAATTNISGSLTKGSQFYEAATKIRELILKSQPSIVAVNWHNDHNVALLFSDDSQIIVTNQAKNSGPLSFDNDIDGYTIFHGTDPDMKTVIGYFKRVYS